MAAATAGMTAYAVPNTTTNTTTSSGIPVGHNFMTNNIDPATEEVSLEKFGPYELPVVLNRATRRRQRIRKLALSSNRPGHYGATQNEVRVYQHLQRLADSPEHILPFRGAREKEGNWLYLNFNYVDGMDFEKYLRDHPSETKTLLIEAAKHLKWLLEVGGHTHGDIKLDNFYRASTGKTYVIDFGKASPVAEPTGDIRAFIKMMVESLGLSLSEQYTLQDKVMREATDELRSEGHTLVRINSDSTTEDRKRAKEYSRKRSVLMYDALIRHLTSMTGGKRRKQRRTHKKQHSRK